MQPTTDAPHCHHPSVAVVDAGHSDTFMQLRAKKYERKKFEFFFVPNKLKSPKNNMSFFVFIHIWGVGGWVRPKYGYIQIFFNPSLTSLRKFFGDTLYVFSVACYVGSNALASLCLWFDAIIVDDLLMQFFNHSVVLCQSIFPFLKIKLGFMSPE